MPSPWSRKEEAIGNVQSNFSGWQSFCILVIEVGNRRRTALGVLTVFIGLLEQKLLNSVSLMSELKRIPRVHARLIKWRNRGSSSSPPTFTLVFGLYYPMLPSFTCSM